MKMFQSDNSRVLMLIVSKHEAYKLLQSLANQLVADNPNVGRYEQILEDGRDFSIAISDKA